MSIQDIAAACRRLGALDSPAAHQSCALTNCYHGGLSASLRTKAAHKAVLLRCLPASLRRNLRTSLSDHGGDAAILYSFFYYFIIINTIVLFVLYGVTITILVLRKNNCNTARRFLCVKKHPRVRDVGGFPRRNLQREKIAVSSSPTVEDLKSHSGLCG